MQYRPYLMPVRPDAPLRKVTLNLYEADCAYLEEKIGHGWSEYVRQLVHNNIEEDRKHYRNRPRTLGDLADD